MDLLQEIALKWPEALEELSQSSGITDDNTPEEQPTPEPIEEKEEEFEDEITTEDVEKELKEEENKPEEDEDEEEPEEEEEKPKHRKNNSNIKKLLSERKELKRTVGDLTTEMDKIKEWLAKVEDGKYYQTEKNLFLEHHPEAKDNMQQIDEVRKKFPKMSFEYAYKIVSPESFVNGTTNPNTRWYTPGNLKAWKDVNTMTTKELDVEVQKQFNEWTLQFFT